MSTFGLEALFGKIFLPGGGRLDLKVSVSIANNPLPKAVTATIILNKDMPITIL